MRWRWRCRGGVKYVFSVGPGLKGSVVERRRKEGSECAQRPLPVRCHSLLLASGGGAAEWDGIGWGRWIVEDFSVCLGAFVFSIVSGSGLTLLALFHQ